MTVTGSHCGARCEFGGGRSTIALLSSAFAIVAALLLVAPAAQAASPFTFAIGSDPDLAVDDAGTAHLVWVDQSPPTDQETVNYCQVPRGATACTNSQTLHTGSPGARPHVLLPAPGQVVVILGEDQCGGSNFCTLARRSFDNGVSFVATQAVADPAGPGSLTGPSAGGDAVYGPGDSVSYTNGSATSGAFFTNASLAGGTESDFAHLFMGSTAGGTVGLFGATPVVAFIDQASPSNLFWRAYDGSGDLNDATNWTAAQAVESDVADAKLAGGPGGLFLMYERGGPGARQYVVRQFTGGGFGSPIGVSEVGDPIFGDLSEDGGGRLHAIWVDNNSSPNTLEWATSIAGGGAWGMPQTLTDTGNAVLPRTNVAAAPDGLGFAAWESGEGGPSGAASELRAIPLEPSGGTPDPCQPPTCLPAGGSASAAIGNSQFNLQVSVDSCETKKVTAKLKIKKRKGKKKKVKVKKVTFKLDGGNKKVDRKAPYKATFSLADAAPGSKHKLTAKAALIVKKKNGVQVKKRVKLSKKFFVCP